MTKAKLQKTIKQAIKDLEPYKAQKIILFGSAAKGSAKENSDIDLLIVKNTKKKHSDRIGDCLDLLYKKEYFGADKIDIPIEPIVYTPQEIKKRLKIGDFFLKDILKHGKIIYER